MESSKNKSWFGAWWDSTDRTKDVKLLSFFMVVVFAISKLSVSEINEKWVEAFYALCALVGLGGTAWAAVEKWGDKQSGGTDVK